MTFKTMLFAGSAVFALFIPGTAGVAYAYDNQADQTRELNLEQLQDAVEDADDNDGDDADDNDADDDQSPGDDGDDDGDDGDD